LQLFHQSYNTDGGKFATKLIIKGSKPSECIWMTGMVHQTGRRVNRRSGFNGIKKAVIAGKHSPNKISK